jgi:ketosteroid isomerase-like protein
MSSELETSALQFTRMWCALFVGDSPDIRRAMAYFAETASILLPNLPYRLGRDEDTEEVLFSHLVDGRGHVHFWQVLEPQTVLTKDVAVVSYYARYNIGRKGESAIKCAKETLVLLRTENDWRILHMHNSPAQ